MLEPEAGKLAWPVLRGRWSGDAPSLPDYEPLKEFDRVFEEAEAEFQRMSQEFERPLRDMETELAYRGVPNLGDIRVEDGITYMVTGVTVKHGYRTVQDP